MKQVKDDFIAKLPDTETEKRAAVPGIYDALREKIMRAGDPAATAAARTAASSTRSATSRAKWACCRARTARRCSQRGETQALVTVTLGTSEDTQSIDTVQEAHYEKRFMLHYNFPPFSVGEVKFLRGPGRREIGHGALAERALKEMLPPEEVFPYTVRIVSDILESNGSSSMASICGGTLALMDAGVPLKSAGGRRGHGPGEGGRQVRDPLRHRRRRGPLRRHGLQGRRHPRGHHRPADGHQDRRHHRRRSWRRRWSRRAAAACTSSTRWPRRWPEPRASISPFAPRIITIKIPVDKIRDIIGPGGKMIRSIVERTGCKIDVEDDGRVSIASTDEAAARKAVAIIEELTATAELNKTYLGKVVRIVDFGAFVEIIPGTDGLLHVSEIAHHRVQDVRSEVKEGDQILVKVVNIDPSGKIRLSRKALLDRRRRRPRRRSPIRPRPAPGPARATVVRASTAAIAGPRRPRSRRPRPAMSRAGR